jgi:hypothetical protein
MAVRIVNDAVIKHFAGRDRSRARLERPSLGSLETCLAIVRPT